MLSRAHSFPKQEKIGLIFAVMIPFWTRVFLGKGNKIRQFSFTKPKKKNHVFSMTKQLKYSSCFCCQFIIKSLQLKSQLPENTIILTLYMHYFYLVVNIISLFICRHVLYLHVSRMLYLIYIELIPLSLKIILKRIYLSTYQ